MVAECDKGVRGTQSPATKAEQPGGAENRTFGSGYAGLWSVDVHVDEGNGALSLWRWSDTA